MNIELIRAAKDFAHAAHAGQYDDDGRPHFAHCASVFEILEVVTEDSELLAAAYLHDTLEDTATSYEQLEEMFGDRVASLVYEVTKVDGEFPNLKSKPAIMLKFADRLHNLSRMSVWKNERQQKYMNKSNFWEK